MAPGGSYLTDRPPPRPAAARPPGRPAGPRHHRRPHHHPSRRQTPHRTLPPDHHPGRLAGRARRRAGRLLRPAAGNRERLPRDQGLHPRPGPGAALPDPGRYHPGNLGPCSAPASSAAPPAPAPPQPAATTPTGSPAPSPCAPSAAPSSPRPRPAASPPKHSTPAPAPPPPQLPPPDPGRHRQTPRRPGRPHRHHHLQDHHRVPRPGHRPTRPLNQRHCVITTRISRWSLTPEPTPCSG